MQKTTTTIDIHLDFNKAFQWINNKNTWFIGYFFDRNDNYISGTNAIKHFENCTDFNQFTDCLKSADGIFSIVVKFEDKVFAASDRSRFFPLFYTQKADKFFITDNFYRLINVQPNISFNTNAIVEFLSSAITNDSKTLVQNILQVRPGEAIQFENLRVKKEYFTSMVTGKTEIQKKKHKDLLDEGYAPLERVRERLQSSLKGKKVLLPLSAGYDSRLLAAWLKLSGIENVICFTFGRKNAPEVDISKKVAELLGFDWHYIEYNNKLIDGYKETKEFDLFFKYMSRGTSMFYMQEFFAIRELINRKIVDKDFVVLPGHSGDFLAGSQLKKVFPINSDIRTQNKSLLKGIYIHSLLNKEQEEKLSETIMKQINELSSVKDNFLSYSVAEDWFVKEKIAKYIFNSAHAFTFYGLEVRFPFWDNTLFDYWRTVPVKYRKNKKLYNDILIDKYFKPLNIFFKNEQQATPKDITIQNIKKQIRPYLSIKAKHNLLKKNDWVFYDEITSPLLDDLKEKGVRYKDNGSSYLYRILYWYIMKLEEEFFI
jgi:asparagine synthase (glutamine-hydrolysing)